MIDGLNSEEAVYKSDGFLRQLWRFSGHHTIVGTTLSLVFFGMWLRVFFPRIRYSITNWEQPAAMQNLQKLSTKA